MPQIGRNAVVLVVNDPAFTVAANPDGSVEVAPGFTAPVGTLKSAVSTPYAAGSPFTQTITVGGTYVVGDEIRVTIVSNDESRQLYRKSYAYIVSPGDTNTTIATKITAMIATDGLAVETPYTATSAGAVITVVAKSAVKNATRITVFENSALGTLTLGAAAATRAVGTPAHLISLGAKVTQLAPGVTYDVVRVDYEPTTAVPFIDTKGVREVELYVAYNDAGTGAADLVAEVPN
jgi:hypothetical protein